MTSDGNTKLGEIILVDSTFEICFACVMCPFIVDSIEEFKEHSQSHLPQKEQTLKIEEYWESSMKEDDNNDEDFKDEETEKTDKGNNKLESYLLTCDCCEYISFPCKGKLLKHITEKFDIKVRQCDDCEGLFTTEQEIQIHAKIHSNEVNRTNVLNCTHCHTVLYKSQYNRHLNIEDFESIMIQKSSLELPTESNSTIAGNLLEQNLTVYQCSMCWNKFSGIGKYSQHIKFHDNVSVEIMDCAICNELFSSLEYLKYHMITCHIEINMLPCTICGKTFKRNADLSLHLRFKHGQKVKKPEFPYECEFCNKKFRRTTNMISHIRTHTGIKPFECSICLKKFTQSKAVSLHMRTHTQERPYSCTICNKQFKLSSTLNNHMKRHNGIRPHKCNDCDRRFVTTHELQNHIRASHTNEKPFMCDICGKSFTKAQLLKQHSFSHGEKTFQCEFCSMKFTSSTGKRGHERKVHKDYRTRYKLLTVDEII